jgi:hypothetical protein
MYLNEELLSGEMEQYVTYVKQELKDKGQVIELLTESAALYAKSVALKEQAEAILEKYPAKAKVNSSDAF